jgi:hypothetical protein
MLYTVLPPPAFLLDNPCQVATSEEDALFGVSSQRWPGMSLRAMTVTVTEKVKMVKRRKTAI